MEKPFTKCAKRLLKNNKTDYKFNKLVKFIENAYNYAVMIFPKYSNDFSKKLYSQPALFTILAIKIYTKSTYRQVMDLLNLSDNILRFLGIKKAPHFTTIQKFFQKKILETKLKEINNLIINENVEKCELIALDGTGFTNDYADKNIMQKYAKKNVKAM